MIRSFSWTGFAIFLLFIAGLAAWSWSGVLLTTKTLSFEEHADYFLSLFQRNLLSYAPMYLLVTLADGLPLAGRPRLAAIVTALVAGALLAVQARCALIPMQMMYIYSTPFPYCTSFPTWRTYLEVPSTVLGPLTIAALVAVFVFSRRRDRELAAALHAAREAQIEARRNRIESEIEAMHARVDPDRLIETLRSVRDRYEDAVAKGEDHLDELIRELRRAARPMHAVPGGTD
jgi:signal transduction histidine kinase